ncbi:hypothetical protein Tco_1438117 [Tanacetum coccineum]
MNLLTIPLDEIHIDEKLNFIEEPVEIMDREVKRLKQSCIPIVKVRWNSRRGPEYTWEREDQMQKKYPHLFADPIPRLITVPLSTPRYGEPKEAPTRIRVDMELGIVIGMSWKIMLRLTIGSRDDTEEYEADASAGDTAEELSAIETLAQRRLEKGESADSYVETSELGG